MTFVCIVWFIGFENAQTGLKLEIPQTSICYCFVVQTVSASIMNYYIFLMAVGQR